MSVSIIINDTLWNSNSIKAKIIKYCIALHYVVYQFV